MAEHKSFEVKAYPDMWKSPGMNVERFEKLRCVLDDVYQKAIMLQDNRPKGMDYFDNLIAEIRGGGIAEILEAKKNGSPVVGTFCVFVPEKRIVAAGGRKFGDREPHYTLMIIKEAS